MNRADRRRQTKDDDRVLVRGIDPESGDPHPTAAMARKLFSLLERAKQNKNIDPTVSYLYSKVDATVKGLSDVPIACKKGCSHCCYIWVSVLAPEALFISKIIKAKGQKVIERVNEAYAVTKDFTFDDRDEHPYPCPLLEDDVCSIYESRPRACRLAASADAEICARAYHNLSDEDILMPLIYLGARGVYGIAAAAALRRAGLPHCAYEFNGALSCALQTDNAERRWLSGEDIFANVTRDPTDVFVNLDANELYKYAFGGA